MINYEENFSLKRYNSFGFDIIFRVTATTENDQEIVQTIEHCKRNDLEWFILGGGSNIIFSRDYDGLVIHPSSKTIARQGDLVVADAGVDWDNLVAWSVAQGLGGIENLSLIPGTVGASPVQNIGAYGVEVKDVIEWVEHLETNTLQINKLTREECQFGYRDSIFKSELRGKVIVLRVAFRLNPNPSFNIEYGDLKHETERLGGISLENIRQAVINIRTAKLPDPRITGNAGSFFKNPIVTQEKAAELALQFPIMPQYKTDEGAKIPAGWLIDQSGWKGFRRGDAGVHPNQALVLVNYGSASPREILDLATEIIIDIEQKFGIILVKEVNVW